jgi:hypothetical protein
MKLLSFIILSLLSLPLFAQNNMNDYMRQTGKIYVVFGVILIIFIGIVIFLIRLERKIKKLENKINHE